MQANGIEVLLAQVSRVDRPFTFAVLSVLTRHKSGTSQARNKVRDFPQALPLLLTKFAERPYDYSPPDDPAASLLFLSTWSWNELKEELDKLGEPGFDAYDVLETAHLKRYSWTNMLADTVSACTDYGSEIGNSYFYITTGKYEFLALSCAGILFNTTMSTYAMKSSIWKKILNVFTFGYYNLVAEGQVCWELGVRTDASTGLKMFRNINAMIRFLVGTYSLLVAGYYEGYPELSNLALAIRWVSVASSLFFMTLANCDVVKARTMPGRREYGRSFLRWAQTPCFYAALVLYQGSEIWSQVTLLIFQMVSEPVGLYVCWGVHLSVLAIAVFIMDCCQCNRYTFLVMPMALLYTTNGGRTTELQNMSRVGSILRVLVIGSTWTWIYLKVDSHPNLMHHLERKSCLALISIAIVGSVVHVFSFLHMVCVGRFRFENMDSSHRGDYDQIQGGTSSADLEMGRYKNLPGPDEDTGESKVRKETGALYDTASEAPQVVALRWKMVHELLPNATARVPHDEFVAVHQTLSGMNSPDRKVDSGSAYIDFLDVLFVAATGLMYPKEKKDLGKHCFGYASLLTNEYYESPAGIPDSLGLLKAPAVGWFDPLKVIRVQLGDDWAKVKKDGEEHVDLAHFKKAFMRRHELKLGGISVATREFQRFLETVFEAVRRISGRSDQPWVDRHGFIYGGLFVYEFYFADARDHERAEGCGCSTPVADNLGITVPLPAKAPRLSQS